eukprot:COSAG02_NODE_17181_length_1023_cov_0.975108_1_plen_113_part_10
MHVVNSCGARSKSFFCADHSTFDHAWQASFVVFAVVAGMVALADRSGGDRRHKHSELAEHVAAVADAASTQFVKPAGRGGRLHRLGNLCPQNAHETEWSDCACNDGFAFDGKY